MRNIIFAAVRFVRAGFKRHGDRRTCLEGFGQRLYFPEQNRRTSGEIIGF